MNTCLKPQPIDPHEWEDRYPEIPELVLSTYILFFIYLFTEMDMIMLLKQH